jgi:hypothetical protein
MFAIIGNDVCQRLAKVGRPSSFPFFPTDRQTVLPTKQFLTTSMAAGECERASSEYRFARSRIFSDAESFGDA